MEERSDALHRGAFLRTAGLAIAGGLAAGSAPATVLAAGGQAPPRLAETPDAAIAQLKAGNARFVAGTPTCGPVTARRLALAEGQAPFAGILGCADSRVPLDTVFDTAPGHLFGVRVAGNFANNDGIGSMEYGVAVLGIPVIVVLGHGSCGAVDSTIKFVKGAPAFPGHIQDLVVAIEPAVKATKGSADWLNAAIAENVKMNVAALPARSSIVKDAVGAGKLKVVGAVYDLHSGKVAFL